MLASDARVITLFPSVADLVWSIVNLALWLGIVGGIVYGVVYLRRLGQRVKRLEERLDRQEK